MALTQIVEPITKTNGLSTDEDVWFIPEALRQNAGKTGTVTAERIKADISATQLTVSLDPGRYHVQIGLGALIPIVVPVSLTSIRLWPLIDAGAPPPVHPAGFVRNSGGISRVEPISTAAYAALPTPDPTTLYITFD